MDAISERQASRLRDLIHAAQAALPAAERGLLFCSERGGFLIGAAFDLFECDDLFDLRSDVLREADLYRSFRPS